MHTLDTLLRFSESGILHYDQEVPDGDAFGEDAARCTRTSTLFHELAGTLIEKNRLDKTPVLKRLCKAVACVF
jgi:hypothetical protein